MEVRVSNDARAIAVRRSLKEAWSKCASRWTRTDTRRERRASGQLTAKPISIKYAERGSGDCAQKAIELTPGDLFRVASATEAAAILAVGLAFAFNAMVGSIILEAINSGALTRPIDILTCAGYFQTVRIFGGEAGAAYMQHFIPMREQFHSNILGLAVSLGR